MIQSIKTSEIGLELSRKGAKTQSYFFCISFAPLPLCGKSAYGTETPKSFLP